MNPRGFLFLQGGATPFFRQLGRALLGAGHRVYRINFCAGDGLFWRGLAAWNFRAGVDRLPEFLEAKFLGHGITDLVVFGDCRPLHRIAIAAARKQGVVVHVFEEGYLRPDWITLERDGVNGYSTLPREGRFYLDRAAALPEFEGLRAIPDSLFRRAWYDILYHIANFLFASRYPEYRNHRQDSAPMEYIGWVGRFSMWPVTRSLHQSLYDRILNRESDYFLFPLQLSADSQIQIHSPFDSMKKGIDYIVVSFARNAPETSRLVIKRHPLDTGLFSYQKYIDTVASRCGISKRVFFVDGGDLSELIGHARGVVTVNSTVGMATLRAGCPLFAIGTAIYGIPGLIFQRSLEQFWISPEKPDPTLTDAFLKVLVHSTQIRGNYYSPDGIAASVEGAMARFAAESSPPGIRPEHREDGDNPDRDLRAKMTTNGTRRC